MTEQIFDILIKVAAVLLLYGVIYLGKYAIAFVKSKLSDRQLAKLRKFIDELVTAAEQMLKKDDPDGSIRLAYVQNMLVDAGYDITEAIMAMIESAVFNVNLSQKAGASK